MKYRSTRGDQTLLTFEEALMTAYASDGGLLMPDHVPEISFGMLENWKTLPYKEVVKKVISMFISEDEIPICEQSGLVDKAFKKFDIEDVVKISPISDHIQVMELWHGESMTFKHLAMSCVTVFLEYFLERRQRFFTAFVVTSGDTGASAALSIRGKPNMEVIVLYPENAIGEIPEQLMTSISDENVHIYAVDGDMFDCDSLLLKIFRDKTFVTRNSLGTMNSMNCFRILVQMAHHVYAYLQAARNIGDIVDIVVPIGGAGNLTGCYLAQQCGLPIRAHAITNENKCFNCFVSENKAKRATVISTIAPGMDTSFPLNFERIMWLASNQSGEIVSNAMTTFFDGGEVTLPTSVHQNITKYIQSSSGDKKDMMEAMKKCYREYNYPVCPHTAVAMSYVFSRNLGHHGNKVVVMATASPAMFPETFDLVRLPKVESEKVDNLRKQQKRYTRLEKGSDWTDLMCKQIETITHNHV